MAEMELDLNTKTVLELREIARNMKVPLSSGIHKTEIIERLNAAMGQEGSAVMMAVPQKKGGRRKRVEALESTPEADVQPEASVSPREEVSVSSEQEATVSPAATAAEPTSEDVPSSKPAASVGSVSMTDSEDDSDDEEAPEAPSRSVTTSRPTYPITPRFGSKPAYQAPAGGNRPAPRPSTLAYENRLAQTRPGNGYTPRFGPAAQADSSASSESRGDYRRSAPGNYSGYDRRPNYPAESQDRRPAYSSAPAQPRFNDSPSPARYGEPQPPRYGNRYDQPSSYSSRPQASSSFTENEPSANPELMLTAAECPEGEGILETHPDGYGFLRGQGMVPSSRDVYVSMAQVKRFGLRSGDLVVGRIRPQRDGDKYSALLYLTSVNGTPVNQMKSRPNFDELTACYPTKRIDLDIAGDEEHQDVRLIDLIAPIGFGQRAMIHCPPETDRSRLMGSIAEAISKSHPDAEVMILLLGGTPEDATELRDQVICPVIASTFDQAPETHLRVSDLMLERAMRLVEEGKDVVLLVDSLTFLSKVYTASAVQQGRTTIGMVNPASLQKAKRLFGAARCVREGGSLSIFALLNVQTGNRVDDSIAEDLKGTANMELILDGAIARAGVYPPINLTLSGTKRAESIATPEQIEGIRLIRGMLSSLRPAEIVPQLLSMLDKAPTNEDLFARVKDWAALMNK